ncbi:hypothetical protein PTKIN_Ptkin13bG0286600 [Pterospermum kingtungense]
MDRAMGPLHHLLIGRMAAVSLLYRLTLILMHMAGAIRPPPYWPYGSGFPFVPPNFGPYAHGYGIPYGHPPYYSQHSNSNQVQGPGQGSGGKVLKKIYAVIGALSIGVASNVASAALIS